MSRKALQVTIPAKHREEGDGFGFGVLDDGVPYVSLRGLAALCGVHHSTIQTLREKWEPGAQSGRDRAIADIYTQSGSTPPNDLAFDVTVNGHRIVAFGEPSAIAIIHYYAKQGKEGAINTTLRLIGRGLRSFIYELTGYEPGINRLDSEILRRLDLNDVPLGCFSVLHQGVVILQAVRRAGGELNSETLPDISVGMAWAKHWKTLEGDSKFGARLKHPHEFPPDYGQARGFRKDAWIYPDSALPEFRRWLYETYIANSLPQYFKRKVKDAELAEKVLKELRNKPKLKD